MSPSRGISWSSSPASPVPAKVSLASILFMPKVSGATWESLSAYARQFLGRMEKPDVDYIEGLSPAISIDQKASAKIPAPPWARLPRFMTISVCFSARVGHAHCPQMLAVKITSQTVEQIVLTPSKTCRQSSRILILSAAGQRTAKVNISHFRRPAQAGLCPASESIKKKPIPLRAKSPR